MLLFEGVLASEAALRDGEGVFTARWLRPTSAMSTDLDAAGSVESLRDKCHRRELLFLGGNPDLAAWLPLDPHRLTSGCSAPMTASIADAEEVRAHLVAAASAGCALTYSELLERLGYNFSRPKMRALCVTLGVVDRDAAVRHEPELAVLVVRQSDRLPGQGWWVAGGASDHDYTGPWEGPRAASLVRKLQGLAFAYWANRSP